MVEPALHHGISCPSPDYNYNEMLGTADGNEPLQAMMKDRFAKCVVQKVLETSDNHTCMNTLTLCFQFENLGGTSRQSKPQLSPSRK
ncbi:hypothetical protein ZWY2020_045230 [Hordeum vulgare]|nr:hypothetical protein ZWY2020_045230 [Hordeum vulgare]